MTLHNDAQHELSMLFPDATIGLANCDLDREDRLIYQPAETIAIGALSEFRGLLGAALENGVTPVQVKELAYQAVAYVGVARVVDFIAITNDVLTERACGRAAVPAVPLRELLR